MVTVTGERQVGTIGSTSPPVRHSIQIRRGADSGYSPRLTKTRSPTTPTCPALSLMCLI